jgi:hypothetical protein
MITLSNYAKTINYFEVQSFCIISYNFVFGTIYIRPHLHVHKRIIALNRPFFLNIKLYTLCILSVFYACLIVIYYYKMIDHQRICIMKIKGPK